MSITQLVPISDSSCHDIETQSKSNSQAHANVVNQEDINDIQRSNIVNIMDIIDEENGSQPTIGNNFEITNIADMMNEHGFVRDQHSDTDGSTEIQTSDNHSMQVNADQNNSDDGHFTADEATDHEDERLVDSENYIDSLPSSEDQQSPLDSSPLQAMRQHDSIPTIQVDQRSQLQEETTLEITVLDATATGSRVSEIEESRQQVPVFTELSPPPSVGNTSLPTTPPPTYAEAIKDAIPLSFIDFWPQCVNLNDENFLFSKFETFDRIIDAANTWLLEQQNIVIRNCETVEVKASSLDEFITLTASKASTFKSNCRPLLNIKGLRVWYTSKIINKLPFVYAVAPCVLAYKNYKAELVNLGDRLEYEKFPSLLNKCNADITGGLLKGRVLNIETIYIKEPGYSEPNNGKLMIDSDDTTWRDYFSKTAMQVLRIYYIPEQQVQEEVKYKDFVPERSRRSRSHPKYRDFSTVMDDCRLWLVHLSTSYRVINAQTLEMKHIPRGMGQMDSSVTYFSDFEGSPRVRFLRIYYGLNITDIDTQYGAPLLSHKTFIPAPLKKKRHETLASVMHRVETWLRATGATVVCAETLPMLEQTYQEKNDADFSLYRSEWMEAYNEFDHETYFYIVRVYLDTVYPEPPPQIFLDGDDYDFDQECVLL